ncbi:MAG: MBL fold metallo-hydrolase [Planctomycetota bacterium]
MMTRRDAILTGAGLAAGLMLPAARARAASPARLPVDDHETFFPWTRLADGVHAVIDLQTGGNVMLVTGNDEAVIVDTKFPAVAAALLREAQGIGPRVRFAVNTHHHGDHTGGNGVLQAAGVPVIAHKNTEARIPGNWDAYSGGISGGARFVGQFRDRPTQARVLDEAGELMNDFQHMEADDWMPESVMSGDERELAVGGRVAELKHFGRAAHTDNDVIVHLADANVMHTGDLVFNGLHPFFDPSAGVDAEGWIEVLRRVRSRCDDHTTVVPGHGPVGGPDIIDAQRVYIEQLIEAVRKDIDAGVPKDETLGKTFDFMEGLGFEQIRPRAIGAVHDQLSGG